MFSNSIVLELTSFIPSFHKIRHNPTDKKTLTDDGSASQPISLADLYSQRS